MYIVGIIFLGYVPVRWDVPGRMNTEALGVLPVAQDTGSCELREEPLRQK